VVRILSRVLIVSLLSVSLSGNIFAKENDVFYYNRYSKKMEKEKIMGASFIKFLSENKYGKRIIEERSKMMSDMMGKMNKIWPSARKVGKFIQDYSIKMNQFVIPNRSDKKTLGYKSFNDFFIRPLRPKVREKKYPQNFKNKNSIIAFADARYLGFNKWSSKDRVPVKGHMVKILDLLGKKGQEYKDIFEGGPMVIARLAPVDYHRFHFPVEGKIVETWDEGGPLYSVSPLALSRKNDILFTNKRRITIVNSPTFGHLAYVEVGATGVGAMVDTFKTVSKKVFKKGQEKGYFEFGGSSIVLLGDISGKWKLDEDLRNKTKRGTELFIEFGDSLGKTTYGK
jgi:phosphatidylserine decarboxylase